MNILHIASIGNDRFSGVDVVVPEHVKAQGMFATVSFLNVRRIKIDGIKNQIDYTRKMEISGFDIAVFHEAYRVEYLSIYKELLRQNIPYIIIPHGELSEGAQRKKRLKKRLANLLAFNRFINGAAALQMLSRVELDNTRFGKRKFISTNGITMPKRHKESFNVGMTRIVYIGRLDPYHKGLDLMLDAVSSIGDFMRRKNASVSIYGPEQRGVNVRGMILKRGIEDIVFLRPAISGRKKERVLLSSDLFIQTSRFEGMPMGILEALSYGLPCVLTEGTTLGEFVFNIGAGFPSRTDKEDVARAIKDAVLSRSEYKRLSENAREGIKRSFSWDVVAADCIDCYKEILRSNDGLI